MKEQTKQTKKKEEVKKKIRAVKKGRRSQKEGKENSSSCGKWNSPQQVSALSTFSPSIFNSLNSLNQELIATLKKLISW